jgi:uncharacterized protein (DUF927 family)
VIRKEIFGPKMPPPMRAGMPNPIESLLSYQNPRPLKKKNKKKEKKRKP